MPRKSDTQVDTPKPNKIVITTERYDTVVVRRIRSAVTFEEGDNVDSTPAAISRPDQPSADRADDEER